MTTPLDGLRVLDVSFGLPGAVASMILADYGADVVHVDPPAGVGPAFVTAPWDRGRRRVRADLRLPDLLARFLELAAGADVVIVGLAPSSARRLGLDRESILAVNPDVIYVGLTGFGLDSDRAVEGLDSLVAAELGAMVTATPARRDGPVFLGHPAVAYSTALVAVIGILAAVRARVAGGRGDVLDVSLQDGLLAQFTMNWWTEQNVSFLADRRADGQLDLGHTRMLVRRYRCRDGVTIQVHTGAAGAFGRLMDLVGLADLVTPAQGPVESATPLTDADLIAIESLPGVFGEVTSEEWLHRLWSNEIAALPVLAPAEVFDDEQVRHNSLVRTIDDPNLGSIEVVDPPIRLSLTPATSNGPDVVVEDLSSARWFGAGLQDGGRAELTDGPLSGVSVLELSTFFASPYATRFLRDLGAEVIKVEPPSGDPMRNLPDPFEGASRGKRSITLDLKDPSDRETVHALIRRADVVQHNFRPGVAERLQVDAASARALNPNVIYDYAPGYGSSGPKSGLQSFAPLHSGFVGIHTEAAGEGNVPTLTFGNEDYYNGQLNAIGVLLALVARERTGNGQDVECAQLSSSVFVTSHWYRRDGERITITGTLDAEQWGWSETQRIYQCLTGYVCVMCSTPTERAALRRTVLGAQAGLDTGEDTLVYEFFGRNAEEWATDLAAAGVPAAVVNEAPWIQEYLSDAGVQAAGRATRFEHHRHGQVSVIGQIVRLASCPPREPVRAPLLGEHTDEILEELQTNGALS